MSLPGKGCLFSFPLIIALYTHSLSMLFTVLHHGHLKPEHQKDKQGVLQFLFYPAVNLPPAGSPKQISSVIFLSVSAIIFFV
jgi:hypothetical protein